MTITGIPYLKDAYLSHIFMINQLREEQKKEGADVAKIEERIQRLQQMADVADNEITDNEKRGEY